MCISKKSWCDMQGGLKGFSARKSFPDQVKYFEFLAKIWDKGCQMASSLEALEAKGKDQQDTENIFLWKGTVAHLTWKSLKTSLAIQGLLERGFIEDALILIRSILESAITLKFIELERDNRVRLYHEYSFIYGHRVREYYKKSTGKDVVIDTEEKRIFSEWQEKEYQRVKDNYEPKTSWSPKSIFEMAQDTGFESHYRTIYAEFCQFSHNTVNSTKSYIRMGKSGGFTITISPTAEDAKELATALHLATSYTLMILDIFNDVFSVIDQAEMANYISEFNQLYGISG